jgi:hypothetical protein
MPQGKCDNSAGPAGQLRVDQTVSVSAPHRRSHLLVKLYCAIALLCLVGGATFARAQDVDNQIAATACTVRGTVVDSVSGQPVARAMVQLGDEQHTMLTDSDGRFEFDGIPPGTQQVFLRKPGYLESRSNFSAWHTLSIRPNMADVTLTLLPGAEITGQVSLSTGDTADGIRVLLLRSSMQDGRATWMPSGISVTDSQGGFRFADLQPGRYVLFTQPSIDRDTASAPVNRLRYGYPATYYPAAGDFSSAGRITLNAGQHFQAEIPLSRQPFYPVTATVTNRDNVNGLSVQVRDRSGRNLSLPVEYLSQGRVIRTNLPTGNYILEATSFGFASSAGRTEVAVSGAAVHGLNLTLMPSANVVGRVRREQTHTQGNAEAQNNRAVHLSLAPADDAASSRFGRPNTESNEDDAFQFNSVAPGRYWVQADASQGYIASLTAGGVNLARDPLVIEPGNSNAPIEVTVRDDSATLSVSLNPQAGDGSTPQSEQAYFYAIPMFDTVTHFRWGTLQGANPQSFAGMAPGTYRVFAFDAPQDIEYRNPEAMQAYAGKGKTVTLESNGSASVQLDITPSQP